MPKTATRPARPTNDTDRYLRAAYTLLQLFVKQRTRRSYLAAVVRELSRLTGCRRLGVRVLNPRNEIPYEATRGFTPGFLRSECWLSLKRDNCVCPRIMRGERRAHERPFLTTAGAFACNDTAAFTETLSARQRRGYRNTCVAQGFASVAVTPLQYQGRVVGAIHLADRRPGCVGPEVMRFVESIAPLIGEAIHRFNVEEELRASDRLLRAVFDEAFQFMGLLDADGALLQINRTALRFAGTRHAEVEGRPLWEWSAWSWSRQAQKRLRAAVAEAAAGRFVRYEEELHGAGGKARTIDFSLKPVRDEKGRVARIIAEGRDVTELRALERRMLDVAAGERARVGRDLHDVLGQQLTATGFLAEALAKGLTAREAPEAPEAARISAMLGEATSQTRALARGLCPVEMKAEGLMAALEGLATRVASVYGIRCRFQCDAPVLVRDAVVAQNLFLIAQEAVNNAVKHARARQVVIRLSAAPSMLSLMVRDNGVGLPSAPDRRPGMGLRVMRHRAATIGARLDIRAIPSGGVMVVCWVPQPHAHLEVSHAAIDPRARPKGRRANPHR
jgi:PAS domain S-box-containing protein